MPPTEIMTPEVAYALMRPGDVVAFGGKHGVSPIIKAVVGTVVSHLAMIRQGKHQGSDVLIVESTIYGGRNGVQTNSLPHRVTTYDPDGCVWWLQLSDEVRADIRWFDFYKFIGAADGHTPYDTPGLFKFFVRAIPLAGPLFFQRENATALFCSGADVAIFRACGVLRGINVSTVTPQTVCEMNLYSRCVQIAGPPTSIARFNTVQ